MTTSFVSHEDDLIFDSVSNAMEHLHDRDELVITREVVTLA